MNKQTNKEEYKKTRKTVWLCEGTLASGFRFDDKRFTIVGDKRLARKWLEHYKDIERKECEKFNEKFEYTDNDAGDIIGWSTDDGFVQYTAEKIDLVDVASKISNMK